MSIEEDVIGCGDDTNLLREVYLIGAGKRRIGGDEGKGEEKEC
jgi:hypothetical protein